MLNTLKRRLGRKWIRPKPRTRQVWYVGENTLLTETWFRRRIYLDSMDTSLTPTIARSGKWEPPVTDFLHSELKRGDRFMDIGANCGFFSVFAAYLVGPQGVVIAIEPQAKLGKLIRQSLSANGYQDFAVVRQTAVGAETQEAELAKSDHLSGSASLAGLGRQQDSTERVTVRPLPDIVSEVQAELGRDATPTVMKIDVEGFEEQVWIGARDTFAACDSLVICLEFSPQRYRELGSSPQAFMQRIREDGFDVARLERNASESPVLPGSALEKGLFDMNGHADLILRKGQPNR